jgi:uncharacterized protein YkwD
MTARLVVLLFACTLTAHGQAPPAQPDLDQAARQIVDRTNQFRQEQQRAAVTSNEKLTASAREFAAWMAATDMYGHEADGRHPWDRAKAHGYDYCLVSENIAYAWRSQGFATADLVTQFVEGWQKSPGHRKNMLEADVTEIGVGVARSADTGLYYAVQVFGRPKSLRIEFRVANRTGEVVKYKVGEQEYELKPRMTMTHQVCRPEEVTIPSAKVRPANGERYVVTRTDRGVLDLVKEAP